VQSYGQGPVAVGVLLTLAMLAAVVSRAGGGGAAVGGEGRAPLAALGETKVGLETIVLPSGRKFELYVRRTDGGGKRGAGVADVLLLHGRGLHSFPCPPNLSCFVPHATRRHRWMCPRGAEVELHKRERVYSRSQIRSTSSVVVPHVTQLNQWKCHESAQVEL
jgi:hypothetical protein